MKNLFKKKITTENSEFHISKYFNLDYVPEYLEGICLDMNLKPYWNKEDWISAIYGFDCLYGDADRIKFEEINNELYMYEAEEVSGEPIIWGRVKNYHATKFQNDCGVKIQFEVTVDELSYCGIESLNYIYDPYRYGRLFIVSEYDSKEEYFRFYAKVECSDELGFICCSKVPFFIFPLFCPDCWTELICRYHENRLAAELKAKV